MEVREIINETEERFKDFDLHVKNDIEPPKAWVKSTDAFRPDKSSLQGTRQAATKSNTARVAQTFEADVWALSEYNFKTKKTLGRINI